MQRERKVNVEKLSEEQLDPTAVVVGQKVNDILIAAKAEADKILAIYGLQLDLYHEIKSNSKQE